MSHDDFQDAEKDDAADNEKAEQEQEIQAEDTAETQIPDESEDELDILRAENTDLKEQILRMAAENQNTRKRLVKQQQDAYRYRHQDILRDLALVIDNFERAIETSIDSKDFDAFHKGIVMIERQFKGLLNENYGFERIGSEGDIYDPAIHEAVSLEESSEVPENTVKQILQSGYRLYERVLRPAKVVVLKPVSEEEGKNETIH
ncbi:Heat shock protein GrpE [Olavius algarvensis spirochete endosymbiont]|uniref:nucleotide exchange factor GrpE n=1 Tax=Olavius algarvensis spirochete endosymbiont TaxID=260710 RepID=UPI00068FCF86|nr:nucleotide exchange factor GrpE [Olavius algarvensis spirochete endosymbiont]VDB00025.1 Heat shock protein GrpE [Olavius algarvensis spirochete endosymbiont]